MNFLIGIVFYNFSQERVKILRTQLLNENQVSWLKLISLIYFAQPKDRNHKRNSKFQTFLLNLIHHSKFDMFTSFFVILNLISVLAYYDECSLKYRKNLNLFNLVLKSFFFFEAAIKIASNGFYGSFYNFFENKLLLFIVIT